jgi:general secretion pathway protein D
MSVSVRHAAWVLLVLVGCATAPTAVDEARRHFEDGRGEEALALLQKAAQENPADRVARAEFFRLRDLLLAQWLAQAEALRQSGQSEMAETLYRRVQAIDPANPRAAAGLTQAETDRRHRAVVAAAHDLVRAGKHREAQDLLRPVLAENPQLREGRRLQRLIDEQLVKPVIVTVQLKPDITKPISIQLRDVTVRNVFEVLQRASGVNFVFDRDVRADQRTSITLRNASIEEAIRMALLTNQLEQKVLNENTVFVFPNTPQKQREYVELVVKGFYVSNADVKQTANMIRSLVKTRDIFVDEKINLLVMKDTPAAIRLAERLIAAQDLAEPEVMLEVEVLEVARNRLLELGIRFPSALAVGLVGAAGVPGTVTLREWQNRSSDLVRLSFTDPLFLFSLRQQDGVTNVLANPRIRVKNKDKARVHIGDRVPVITTTAAASGGFVSETVTYLDVGLKLEVEPVISLDDEVGIKVGLEVSNIVREVRGASSSSLTYQIGTRNAATNLRLRDGETQVLAGLISDDDRRTADRVPGLGELPVLGRLFSSTRDANTRTEIVLLITPRLQRTLARPEAGTVEFAAGTEASTGAPRLGGLSSAPAAEAPSTPGAAQEMFGAPAQLAPPGPQTAPGVPAPQPGPGMPGPQPGMPPMLPFGGMKPMP